MADLSRNIIVTKRDIIQASPSAMWGLILDQMRNPAKYIPDVSDVTIVKEEQYFVERKFTLGGELPMHDIISADPNIMSMVQRAHASHPLLSGFVCATVLPDPTAQDEFVGQERSSEARTCFFDLTMTFTAKPAMTQEDFKICRDKMRHALVDSYEVARRHVEDLSKTEAG
jgi:hypothetical protein